MDKKYIADRTREFRLRLREEASKAFSDVSPFDRVLLERGTYERNWLRTRRVPHLWSQIDQTL